MEQHTHLQQNGDISMSASPWHKENPEVDTSRMQSVVDGMKRYTTMANIMRLSGMAMLLAGMIVFLSQKWENGTDMSRFYMLLTQTCLLAVGGFVLSYLIRENKGARLLFGLSLLSITANITTLAALIFSITHTGATPNYPGFAHWQVTEGANIVMAGAIAMVVCVPIAIFALKVLTRNSSALFTASFLACNALLLIPIREGMLIGLIVAIAAIIPTMALIKEVRQNIRLRTLEGTAAMAILYAPAGIIAFRSLWLYPADSPLILMLSVLTFTTLRLIVREMEKSSSLTTTLDWISASLAAVVSVTCFDVLSDIVAADVAASISILVMATLLFIIAQQSRAKEAMITIATIVISAYHVPAALLEHGSYSALMALMAGAAVIILAVNHKLKTHLYWCAATLASGAFMLSHELFGMIDFSSWVTLSVIGGGVILSASLLERHGAILHQRVKSRFSEW